MLQHSLNYATPAPAIVQPSGVAPQGASANSDCWCLNAEHYARWPQFEREESHYCAMAIMSRWELDQASISYPFLVTLQHKALRG